MSAHAAPTSEPLAAARNAVTLGSSLAVTTSVALLVRLAIPRFLGPGPFGELRLAESYGEMLFVLLTFGVDMQLRREAALDPTRARRYLSGLTVLRVALGVVATTVAVGILRATGAGPSVISMFVVTAVGQLLLVLNNSYAALEHAAGDVRWLARTNFGMKVLWAGAMLAVLAGWSSGLAVAAVGLGVEAVRFVWLTMRGARQHGLQARPDVRLAAGAILGSLPIFVHSVAHTFYARIGTGWLGAVGTGHDVGLYAAAANLASIALLGMPLLLWVLVPSAARAAAESPDAMDRLVAGALRVSLLVAVPMALAFFTLAAPLMRVLFGVEYEAAAPILRILAPTFGLAYVSSVCAIALLQQGRTWMVAGISVAGLVLTATLDATLIPWGARTLGPLGAAQGAAWATLITEVGVTLSLGALTPRSWRESALLRTAGALAAGLLGVVVLARALPLSGVWPVAAAAVAFIGAVLAAGGVTLADVAFVRSVLGGTTRRPVPVTAEA